MESVDKHGCFDYFLSTYIMAHIKPSWSILRSSMTKQPGYTYLGQWYAGNAEVIQSRFMFIFHIALSNIKM